MINNIQFEISSLLVKKDDDTVTGAMSPLLFAQEVAKGFDFKFNRLARIWFRDSEVLQQLEYKEMTGYDHLIIGCQYANDLWLSMWVDRGTTGLPVAMGYQSDREVIIAPVYEKASFLVKPQDDAIKTIFNHIFSNPACIAIRQKE